MKRKQLIIVVLFAFSLGLFLFFFINNANNAIEKPKIDQKDQSFSTKIIQNSILEYELIASGEVNRDPESDITFEVSGTLINGDSIDNTSKEFKKNQLLFRINNDEEFAQLATKKSDLIKLFTSILPQLEVKFPTEKSKWAAFLEGIKPIKLLPEFPTLFTPSERIFLVQKGFMQAFVKTKMLEKHMEKYFYLAPFNGKFIQFHIEAGEMVPAGTSVATISETLPLTAKINIPETDIKLYRQINHVHFTNRKGQAIGNGTYLRIKHASNKANLAEVIYTVQSNQKSKINPGDKIKIITSHYTYQKCVSLPYEALNFDKVKVIINDEPVKKTVKIIAKTSTHYFVTGLNDGDKVVLKW